MNRLVSPPEILTTEDTFVLVGYSAGPHGLKGQVGVSLFSGEDSVIKKGATVYALPGPERMALWKRQLESVYHQVTDAFALKITFLQHTPKKTILGFREIPDRTSLDTLGPFGLYLPRKLFPLCREGEFYWSDLFDLTVMSVSEGTVIGKIVDVYDNGAQTVLKMELDNETELDLPFIDEFFPTVDLKKKMIWLNMPEMI